MPPKITIAFLLFNFYMLNAQQKQKDSTVRLVSKGTFFIGVSSNFAFGYSPSDQTFVLPGLIVPKLGYFIADKVSLGVSFQGAAFSSQYPQSRFLYNTGVEHNHYFYARKNFLFHSVVGLNFSQLNASSLFSQRGLTTQLKLGAGATWRPKSLPGLGLNVEVCQYLGSGPTPVSRNLPVTTFGLNYFFKSHKK